MKKINVRFEQGGSPDRIEVIVRASEKDEQTEALISRITGPPTEVLTATGEDGALLRIDIEDIISVSVEKNHTRIVTGNGQYLMRQTLKSLEDVLDPETFIRISRHELVNMDRIEKYDFTLGGTLRLELTGGMETWASRRCIPAIRKRLKGKGE